MLKKIIIIFLFFKTVSIFSQNVDFEEVILRNNYNEIIDAYRISKPALKGDSIFVLVNDGFGKKYGLLSTNKGLTWNNIYPNLIEKKIIFNNDDIKLNPTSFKFYKVIYQDSSKYLNIYCLDGNLITSEKLPNGISKIFQSPFSPNLFIDIDNMYSNQVYQDSNYFSLDYGKTWSAFEGPSESKNYNLGYNFNLRNKNLFHFQMQDNYILENKSFTYNFLENTKIKSLELNGFHYGSISEDEAYFFDYELGYLGNRRIYIDSENVYLDHIKIDQLYHNKVDNSFKNGRYTESFSLISDFEEFTLNNILIKFDVNYIYHNINNPDIKLLLFNYNVIDKEINNKIIDKVIFFSTQNNGETWEYFGEFKPISANTLIKSISINPDDNNIYFVHSYNVKIDGITYYKKKLFKSKSNILSTQKTENQKLKVYFSNNNLIIENQEEAQQGKIIIFDISGKTIYNQELLLKKGTNEIQLNQELNSNLFIVNIEFENKNNIYKLIKP